MFTRKEVTPLSVLAKDLDLVQRGKMPQCDKEALLKAFRLDGEEKDGLTLMSRLVQETDPLGGLLSELKLLRVMGGVVAIIDRIKVGRETPADEQMAQNLSAVAQAQIIREGDICEGANILACELMESRPQYFSEETKDALFAKMLQSALSGFGRPGTRVIVKLGNRRGFKDRDQDIFK